MSDDKRKIDIFKLLERLSVKDYKYFEALSEEELKSIAPLVLMRWLSGTSEARQVYFLNELANPMVFSLSKHKQLLLKLLTICASGKTRKYTWSKAKGKKTSNTPKALEVVKQYYGYSTNHAIDAMKLLSNEQILEAAEYLGTQPTELKEISKELKTRGISVGD
jgi:hypothetical protein